MFLQLWKKSLRLLQLRLSVPSNPQSFAERRAALGMRQCQVLTQKTFFSHTPQCVSCYIRELGQADLGTLHTCRDGLVHCASFAPTHPLFFCLL